MINDDFDGLGHDDSNAHVTPKQKLTKVIAETIAQTPQKRIRNPLTVEQHFRFTKSTVNRIQPQSLTPTVKDHQRLEIDQPIAII